MKGSYLKVTAYPPAGTVFILIGFNFEGKIFILLLEINLNLNPIFFKTIIIFFKWSIKMLFKVKELCVIPEAII